MVEFQYPRILYFLLIVPVLVLLYFYSRYRQRRSLRAFGRPEVISHLMPDASQYMPAVKLVVECVIVALIVLIAARPVAVNTAPITSTSSEKSLSGMEIMICVDVSNSMLASSTDDPQGISRIQRARLLIEKLIDRLEDDKVGLVVFAGDAVLQLPITSDFISAKMFLGSIDPGMVPFQGTAIGSAIDLSVSALADQSDFSKAIIVITDAENFEDDAQAAARNAAKNGIRVDVIGLGSEQGVPLPPINGHQYAMPDGSPIITKFNPEVAKQIAKEGGGVYVNGNSSDAVGKIIDNLSDMGRKGYTRVSHTPADEQFPVLAWIVFALLIVDVFIITRKISWLRRYTFFTKNENTSK